MSAICWLSHENVSSLDLSPKLRGQAELDPGEFNAVQTVTTRMFEIAGDSADVGKKISEIDALLSDTAVEAAALQQYSSTQAQRKPKAEPDAGAMIRNGTRWHLLLTREVLMKPRLSQPLLAWFDRDIAVRSPDHALCLKSASSASGPPIDISSIKPLARACWPVTVWPNLNVVALAACFAGIVLFGRALTGCPR